MREGDRHAVVADGNAGVDGRLEAVAELCGGYHASAALEDEGVVGEGAFDAAEAGNEVEGEFFSSIFLQQGG